MIELLNLTLLGLALSFFTNAQGTTSDSSGAKSPVALTEFLPSVLGLNNICNAEYQAIIPDCFASDFPSLQNRCSNMCIAALVQKQINVLNNCKGYVAGSNNILAAFMRTSGVQAMCNNYVATSMTSSSSTSSAVVVTTSATNAAATTTKNTSTTPTMTTSPSSSTTTTTTKSSSSSKSESSSTKPTATNKDNSGGDIDDGSPYSPATVGGGRSGASSSFALSFSLLGGSLTVASLICICGGVLL